MLIFCLNVYLVRLIRARLRMDYLLCEFPLDVFGFLDFYILFANFVHMTQIQEIKFPTWLQVLFQAAAVTAKTEKEQMTKKKSIGNLYENAKPCYVTLQRRKNKIKEEDKKAQKKSNEMNRNKPILHTGIHENKAAAVEKKQARKKERKAKNGNTKTCGEY